MSLLYVSRRGLIDINNTEESLTVMQPHYLAAAARKEGGGAGWWGPGIPELYQCHQKGSLPVSDRKLAQIPQLA